MNTPRIDKLVENLIGGGPPSSGGPGGQMPPQEAGRILAQFYDDVAFDAGQGLDELGIEGPVQAGLAGTATVADVQALVQHTTSWAQDGWYSFHEVGPDFKQAYMAYGGDPSLLGEGDPDMV